MKTHRIILGVILAGIMNSPAAAQVFVSGSTGADGAFAPAANTTLSLPPSGTFNFTTVTIPAGVTVTFAKNAANTPVTILATGDVTINGTLSVGGGDGGPSLAALPNPQVGLGGPGAYNGGAGGNPGAVNVASGPGGAGLGIGSGGGGSTNQGCGSFASAGCGGSFPTAIPTLLPMLGGSGGGGGGGRVGAGSVGYSGGAGGGGAGSIVIASSGTITVNGSLIANGGRGGNGAPEAYGGGGGSGGGIRLVANAIAGNGGIGATGGAPGTTCCAFAGGSSGGNGIVRLESFAFTYSGSVLPGASFSTPGLVVPPGLPSLTIASIGGSAPPANPAGNFSTVDVALPSTVTNPVPVVVTATNIPVPTGVTVQARPQFGDVTSTNGTLSGSKASSSATINVTLPSGVSVIQVVTNAFTITADLAPFLPFVDGEPVERIRLAAAYGASPQVFYITKSGKEVPAEKYFGRVVSTTTR
jgi:hypothetical protein